MGFNEAQKTAIAHLHGPMMVLAGPGSGKTTVITRRIYHMITRAGVSPASILVVTFTKAAANEMKSRFLKLADNAYTPVSFGTFHSVFFTIIKHAYQFKAGDVITDSRRMEIFREIVREEELEPEEEGDFILQVAAEVSRVKGERIDPEHYYSLNCPEDVFRKIYRGYQETLKKHRLIDFEDMLVYTYELFKARPDILKAWQEKFEYILIDEFQDINLLQYEIIRMLAKPSDHLFIVGDDDQSIYKFRGAKPEIMLNFQTDYPNAQTVLLDVNYRCPQTVVEGAGKVIRNNKRRYPKELRAQNAGGEEIVVKVFKDMQEESLAVVKELLTCKKAGAEFQDMVILFRTNTGSRGMLERLMEYNIPFRMKDSIPNIYEHWIAKDMIAYMRIAIGSQERSDFLRIINRPKRFIARQALGKPQVTLDMIRQANIDKPWMKEALDKFQNDLTMLGQMSPYEAINYIRYGIGYQSYLLEYAVARRLKADELSEILTDLMEASKLFKTCGAWFEHIDDYTERLKQGYRRDPESAQPAGVALMTIHGVKGLEFDDVFILDANERVMPHHKAVLEEEIEEERRLFYVAMTRAKQRLYIYFTKNRYNKEAEMSRFVGEILLDREMLKPGRRIEHSVYGTGQIQKIEDKSMLVRFDQTHEIKNLNLSICMTQNMIKILQ